MGLQCTRLRSNISLSIYICCLSSSAGRISKVVWPAASDRRARALQSTNRNPDEILYINNLSNPNNYSGEENLKKYFSVFMGFGSFIRWRKAKKYPANFQLHNFWTFINWHIDSKNEVHDYGLIDPCLVAGYGPGMESLQFLPQL